jgi:hypothetical protein
MVCVSSNVLSIRQQTFIQPYEVILLLALKADMGVNL